MTAGTSERASGVVNPGKVDDRKPGRKGHSGVESKTWVAVYRRPNGAAVTVTIPRRLLQDANVDPDAVLLVNRRALTERHSIVLEFRLKERVPEADRT